MAAQSILAILDGKMPDTWSIRWRFRAGKNVFES